MKDTLTPTAKLTSKWLKEKMHTHRVRGVDLVEKLNEAGITASPAYVSNLRRFGMSIKRAGEIAKVMDWEAPSIFLSEDSSSSTPTENSTTHITISSLTPRAGVDVSANDSEVIDLVRVSRAWLRGQFPNLTNLQSLALCNIVGDSMEPTFDGDDTILVDCSTKQFDFDGVYVFTYYDTLLIKRIQRRPGVGYMVISDNRDLYEPYKINLEDLANVTVHGRVIGKFGFDRM